MLQEEYRKQLAGNMMNNSSRILAFKSKPPPPPEGFERNARLLYSENIQSSASSGPKRNKIFRHIPQVIINLAVKVVHSLIEYASMLNQGIMM